MIIKNSDDIKGLDESGKILARTLQLVATKVKPGVSAFELNEVAEEEIRNAGATPSFKNYQTRASETAFPAALCVSINNEIVHGIPKKNKILQEGDVVGLDLGVLYNGFFTDAAITVPVGKVSKLESKLIQTTKESLDAALTEVKAGAKMGDIGFAIQSLVEKAGFSVVRDLVGHGVGRAVHEEPDVPGFGRKGTGITLQEGMVLAIEPMVNIGDWKIKISSDGWTIKTFDNSKSAHFEHTILVTKTGCQVLTQA